MSEDLQNPVRTLASSLIRSLRLRCPRCGEGRLFRGWFAMNSRCSGCQLDLEREPGFYLGSIYINYGLTVALVGPTFAILTLGLGYPRNIVVWPCAAFTVLFPLWFFRYARAVWLCLGWVTTSAQTNERSASAGDGGTETESVESQQQKFQSDDAMAAVIIGGALVAIFLMMIVLMVTVGLWTASQAPR